MRTLKGLNFYQEGRVGVGSLSPCISSLFFIFRARSKSLMYSPAEWSHEKSTDIARFCSSAQLFLCFQLTNARIRDIKSCIESNSLKRNPVPVSLVGLKSSIVSASPPVFLAIGTAPYLIASIWVSPQGSNFEGIKTTSAPP